MNIIDNNYISVSIGVQHSSPLTAKFPYAKNKKSPNNREKAIQRAVVFVWNNLGSSINPWPYLEEVKHENGLCFKESISNSNSKEKVYQDSNIRMSIL